MIGLLRNVVAKERDPAVADEATMMARKRRLPRHLTCRRRVSLAVRRVFSFGFEACKQLCREFEPWVLVAISVDAPGPIAVNENGQSRAGNSTAIRQQIVRKRRAGSVAEVPARRRTHSPTRLAARQPDEDVQPCLR